MTLLDFLEKIVNLFNKQSWTMPIEQLRKYRKFNLPLSKYNILISPWINHNEINITISVNDPYNLRNDLKE